MKNRSLSPKKGSSHARLIASLERLQDRMQSAEDRLHAVIGSVAAGHRTSARNFAHYLAMRQVDLRPLQEKLANLGLSSLGRAESHVRANLDCVLSLLYRLEGMPTGARGGKPPVPNPGAGVRLIEQRAEALLGPSPPSRKVRIMVTLSSEAALNAELVRAMVAAGMDIARINCAHDSPEAWYAMARNVRDAAQAEGRMVRILMDLAGPKLRTGSLPVGPAVCKLRPRRDAFGNVVDPVKIGLSSKDDFRAVAGAEITLGVDAAWLEPLRAGDRLFCIDAREAKRSFEVIGQGTDGILLTCRQTVYLTPATELAVWQQDNLVASGPLTEITNLPGSIRVEPGQVIELVRPGDALVTAGEPDVPAPMRIPCTLPEVFADVRPGESIFFDDGRIGGIVLSADPQCLRVEITQTNAPGVKLGADKGINLPDSHIRLPALTDQDLADLEHVVRIADLLGFSFVQNRGDVEALQDHLARLGMAHLGLILKIETRRAFENLPELVFAALRSQQAGIMIARGDLAIECGFTRLAEVQEEILWAAEAAHLPTIWATQVLEGMTKTGLPSRAEITDAAMGERAECVMLNKGPHIVEAIRALDDILRRMQAHQRKKRSLLRVLHSWTLPRR